MAGSVNKVILVGNLGADPEIRRTQDGRPIANLSVATSESWRDKNTGERREKTEWHRVVVFNEGLCKVIENYVNLLIRRGQLKREEAEQICERFNEELKRARDGAREQSAQAPELPLEEVLDVSDDDPADYAAHDADGL